MWQKPPLGAQIEYRIPGLVACWPMNENSGTTIFDLSQGSNNGVITTASWTIDELWSAINFEAGSENINCGSKSVLDDMFSFSVVAWIKPDATNTTGSIAAKGSSAEWQFHYFHGAAQQLLRFEVDYDTTNCLAYTATTLDLSGGWHQVAATFDGGLKRGWVFCDGLDVTSTQTDGVGTRTSDASRDFLMGNNRLNTADFLGDIGYEMLFNRVLGPGEIAMLCRAPFWMFQREVIELWAATSGAAPPAGIPIFRRRIEAA